MSVLSYYKSLLDAGKGTSAFSAAFSPEGDRLCVAGEDSRIRQFQPQNAFVQSTVELTSAVTGGRELKMPVVAMAFRPSGRDKEAGAVRSALTVACADGTLSHWHAGSSRVLSTGKEENNEVYAVAYRPDGALFATAGKDGAVRSYEADTFHLLSTMVDGPLGGPARAHTNRIQALRFAGEQTLLSGGWDNMINVWDLRAGRSVAGIFGPYLCGDGLAVAGHYFVTASARDEHQVELWDLRTKTRVSSQTIPPMEGCAMAHMYGAQFSADEKSLVVGGTHRLLAMRFENGQLTPQDIVGVPEDLLQGCTFSIRWSVDDRYVCCAGDKTFLLERSV